MCDIPKWRENHLKADGSSSDLSVGTFSWMGSLYLSIKFWQQAWHGDKNADLLDSYFISNMCLKDQEKVKPKDPFNAEMTLLICGMLFWVLAHTCCLWARRWEWYNPCFVFASLMQFCFDNVLSHKQTNIKLLCMTEHAHGTDRPEIIDLSNTFDGLRMLHIWMT